MNSVYLSSKGYPEVREDKGDPILHPYRFIKDNFNLKRPSIQNQRFFLKATKDTQILHDTLVQTGVTFELTKAVIG